MSHRLTRACSLPCCATLSRQAPDAGNLAVSITESKAAYKVTQLQECRFEASSTSCQLAWTNLLQDTMGLGRPTQKGPQVEGEWLLKPSSGMDIDFNFWQLLLRWVSFSGWLFLSSHQKSCDYRWYVLQCPWRLNEDGRLSEPDP